MSEQPDELQDWAAAVSRVKKYKAGEYLYKAGDKPDGVYGLKSGSVEIEFPQLAKEPVSLLRTNEGFWIGDAALLSKTSRIVSVVAVQDSSFVFLPGSEVVKLLNNCPRHWHSFYDLSAQNTFTAVTLLAASLSLTVRARVCRALLNLSENRVEAQVTQDSLAKTLGIARPTLRRCLSDLVDKEAIEVGYGKVRIVRRAVLRDFEDEQ